MAKLYELTAALDGFELQVDEDTGEITNIDELDALQMERDEKVENVALYIKNLLSDAEAYKREKESFLKKQQEAQRKADSLKEYLAFNLKGEKFKSDRVQISYRKSESVNITDMAELPIEFKVMDVTADKRSIKQAIKEGQTIPGAELVEKEGITIR